MLFNGLRQEMLPCNLNLFVFGVTGNSDHFHAIEQWTWNVERVSGRHKHHIGEIIIDLQIVITEAVILFGI